MKIELSSEDIANIVACLENQKDANEKVLEASIKEFKPTVQKSISRIDNLLNKINRQLEDSTNG